MHKQVVGRDAVIIIGIFAWGLLVGWLGRLLAPGDTEMSWGRTLVVGWLGSLLGAAIGTWIFNKGWFSFSLPVFLAMVVGAIIVVVIDTRLVAPRQKKRQSSSR